MRNAGDDGSVSIIFLEKITNEKRKIYIVYSKLYTIILIYRICANAVISENQRSIDTIELFPREGIYKNQTNASRARECATLGRSINAGGTYYGHKDFKLLCVHDIIYPHITFDSIAEPRGARALNKYDGQLIHYPYRSLSLFPILIFHSA